MVEKCLSLPLFLSFLSSLYLHQSVPCYTESVGLVMMRGIIYTNQSPPLIFFPSLQHGAQLSSLPKMHLSKFSTCCCAVKTHYGYFLCHASHERATDIPPRGFIPENGSHWQKTTPLHFLPCVNLILFLCITKVPQTGRDWLDKCYPFKISIPRNLCVSITGWCTEVKRREGREIQMT